MPSRESSQFVPDFLIAGATRCGTTSLHEALAAHSGVCVPRKKEVKYFYDDAQYKRGGTYYATHFSHREDGQICGEVCPLYFEKGFVLTQDGPSSWVPEDDCAARIYRDYPDVSLLFSLRDPIQRAHSIFWKNKWQGRETADDFAQAVDEELSGKRKPEETPFCFVWRNRYHIHLERWLELFPKEQLHVLLFEEWVKNPQIAVDAFQSVMDLSADPQWGAHCFVKSNEGRKLSHPALRSISAVGDKIPLVRSLTRRFLTQPGYPPIDPHVYARLQEEFREDVTFLETFLGRGIDVWLKGV